MIGPNWGDPERRVLLPEELEALADDDYEFGDDDEADEPGEAPH